MKTISLVGGMSWASSADYYRLINEQIHQRLGGLNYARCILYSFNFEDIHKINQKQDWPHRVEAGDTGLQAPVHCWRRVYRPLRQRNAPHRRRPRPEY